jgi:hypothetical protein
LLHRLNSVRIAPKVGCALIDPSDAAAYLRRHHAEVPARLLYRNEVQGDVMRAGIDEHLGCPGFCSPGLAKVSLTGNRSASAIRLPDPSLNHVESIWAFERLVRPQTADRRVSMITGE